MVHFGPYRYDSDIKGLQKRKTMFDSGLIPATAVSVEHPKSNGRIMLAAPQVCATSSLAVLRTLVCPRASSKAGHPKARRLPHEGICEKLATKERRFWVSTVQWLYQPQHHLKRPYPPVMQGGCIFLEVLPY